MDNSPQRTIENNLLTSTAQPPLKLQIDSSMAFAGRLQFLLYNIAEADIFVFADAAPDGKLKRWLIVQFEGFLANNTHTYNYAAPTRITLGNHDYMFDYFIANLPKTEDPPDSDSAHVSAFLQQNGFTLPEGAIWERFFRVIGDDHRRELLIIYTEDVEPLGINASELSADAPLPKEYNHLAQALHRRALATFTILEG